MVQVPTVRAHGGGGLRLRRLAPGVAGRPVRRDPEASSPRPASGRGVRILPWTRVTPRLRARLGEACRLPGFKESRTFGGLTLFRVAE